jgi:hypothetical protein
MRVTALLVCILSTALPVQAKETKSKIGNFIVSVDKDPFNEGETYVAMTISKGAIFAIRCLEDELSLAMSIRSDADVGDSADVLVKVDDATADTISGQVITKTPAGPLIQFGDKEIVEVLGRATRIALRPSVNGVSSTYEYNLRGVSGIVAGGKKACKVD